ncbi:gfo/Idh/MocA family oxidoreductase [Candidatus Poribacteria bacterium]|nr:gfo/Idh/MocA family oxidoreductase [Candidatus Poribacteria bacterium]
MLKIGMVGAGFVAEFHRKSLESIRGIELAGVCALKGAEELAERARNAGLGDTKVYKSIEEMCKAVDVACIFVPNFVRLTILKEIIDAVKNGAELKGIVCEKPLARNMAEADEMLKLVNSVGVKTAYFENQIHMPSVTNARTQLKACEKSMGSVHLTRSAEEHGGPHEPWFWDPTRQGGGVWCDMGCHSIAVGMYMLTPSGKAPDHLKPLWISGNMALLKWGKEPWKSQLKEKGVDYDVTPAEDYALVTAMFEDPETGVKGVAQATDSWMYDAPGLRLLMEAFGPGYSYTVNSLDSPAGIFISDAAADAIADSELALEKAQATRGALVLQPNEPDLYGYVGEWKDAIAAFEKGEDALLNFEYGRMITMLIMAGYMSHEKGKVLDLTDPKVMEELKTYVPKIQQGKGSEIL